jgi:hypothetical protein
MKYTYKAALTELKIPTLNERRENLSAKLAKKCLHNDKTKGMFPVAKKSHTMKARRNFVI